jgi:hypothetical protein
MSGPSAEQIFAGTSVGLRGDILASYSSKVNGNNMSGHFDTLIVGRDRTFSGDANLQVVAQSILLLLRPRLLEQVRAARRR